MKVRIAQLAVSKNITANKDKIIEVIRASKKDVWVIFPEGMLSGYYPDEDFYLKNLDWQQIETSINEIQKVIEENDNQCIFGTALFEKNTWYNSAIFLDSTGSKKVYRKVNLANLDRKHFTAGNSLEVFDKDDLKFGIQLCRDQSFPEQWKVLKKKGAQVVFHINNAIKETDATWKHVLISRAFENQFFVVSVNNASEPQTLPSLVVSPLGEIIFESKPQKESVTDIEIDLSQVKLDYLKQERTDLLDIVYKY
jgi:predicted amidohydrolase